LHAKPITTMFITGVSNHASWTMIRVSCSYSMCGATFVSLKAPA
jgi:hypothetical protein